MEVNEMIKPNMINGLDLTFSSWLSLLFEKDTFLSFFLLIRLGKGLITIKSSIKLIILKFWTILYGNQQHSDNLLQA